MQEVEELRLLKVSILHVLILKNCLCHKHGNRCGLGTLIVKGYEFFESFDVPVSFKGL